MCVFLQWKIAAPINVNINLDVIPSCLLSRQSSQKSRIPLPSLVFWFVPKVPSYNDYFFFREKVRCVQCLMGSLWLNMMVWGGLKFVIKVVVQIYFDLNVKYLTHSREIFRFQTSTKCLMTKIGRNAR